MGAADEVSLHVGSVIRRSYVIRNGFGDLMLSMEKCGAGARYPRGEEAGVVWRNLVNGSGVMVCKDVDLGIRGEIV